MHYEYQREFQKYNVNAINAHSMRIETKRIPIRIECASSVNRPLVALLNALQNLTPTYCAVANYVLNICHHRTLATLAIVGSLAHYFSVNIYCKCMHFKQSCVCLC